MTVNSVLQPIAAFDLVMRLKSILPSFLGLSLVRGRM